jgi:hypothetical protein
MFSISVVYTDGTSDAHIARGRHAHVLVCALTIYHNSLEVGTETRRQTPRGHIYINHVDYIEF